MEAATVHALRRAGWTLEQIVIETGAAPVEVAAALDAPRSWTLPTLVRAVAWAEQRWAGHRVVQIAARAGVSHQWVSKLTRPFGPFPRPVDPVQEWVAARRAGRRLAAIASDYQVPINRVSTATKPYGPFPYPHRQPHEGLHTPGMARLYGVAEPTVLRWQARPDFPPPLSTVPPPLWDAESVAAWADQHLTACPVCQARVLNLARHRGARQH